MLISHYKYNNLIVKLNVKGYIVTDSPVEQ